MSNAFLTLNLPAKRTADGIPVMVSLNPCLLAFFQRTVLLDWQRRVKSAADEVLRQVDRLEFEKLRLTLDLLVPDDTSPDDSPRFEGKTVLAEHQLQASYKIPVMVRMLREIMEAPEYREKE